MTKLNLYLTKKMKKRQLSYLKNRYKEDKETFTLKKWLDKINSYSDVMTQESCIGHIQGFDRKFGSDAFLSIFVTERLGKFIENNIEKLLTSQYSYGGSAYRITKIYGISQKIDGKPEISLRYVFYGVPRSFHEIAERLVMLLDEFERLSE